MGVGASRDLSARNLASLSGGSADILHYGAKNVALRVFGSADPTCVRTIYYWASEVADDRRPAFLSKIAGKICAWEQDILASRSRPEDLRLVASVADGTVIEAAADQEGRPAAEADPLRGQQKTESADTPDIDNTALPPKSHRGCAHKDSYHESANSSEPQRADEKNPDRVATRSGS